MTFLLLAGLVIIICFAGVLLVGAPYLPTLTPQVKAALELADLKKGETLIELGAGDGKVLLAAAAQGINVIGYELNPILVVVIWLRTRRYRRNVRIIWGDFWRQPWPPTDAIFVFLLAKHMGKLDKKIMQYKHKPVKLVSFAFEVPELKPAAQKANVFLYMYK